MLDILNRPLEQTVDAGNRDPLIVGARYDQLVAEVAAQSAVASRRAAAVTEDAQLRAELNQLATLNEKLAAAAPEVTARQPVTLGVTEPFIQTSRWRCTPVCCCRCR